MGLKIPIPRFETDDAGDDQIKFIPAIVIGVMFACVVLGVTFLRKESNPALAPPVIFLQSEAGEHETLPADSLFDFDKAILGPEAAVRIRQYATRTKMLENVNVVVIGHTDSLGSDHHNGTLSTARANAVREMLIDEGMDRGRIAAIGVGSRIPLKKREECPGKPHDPTVVACLEPNRRVELWTRTLEAH